MTNDQVLALPGDKNPVLCADGAMGMLILYPSQQNEIGVQVIGEKDVRWIACAELEASERGALLQRGGKLGKPLTELPQSLLTLDWIDRGGISIFSRNGATNEH